MRQQNNQIFSQEAFGSVDKCLAPRLTVLFPTERRQNFLTYHSTPAKFFLVGRKNFSPIAANPFCPQPPDKLRSPEKLDTMLSITTPVSWPALIAVLVLLFKAEGMMTLAGGDVK